MLRPVTAVALLVVSLPASAGDTWTRRTVPGHEVSVELPGQPEHRQRERSVVVGSVVSDSLVTRDAEGWCAATVSKPPRMAMVFVSDSNLLERARDSLLEDYAGRRTAWRPIARDGHEGMRLEFSTSRTPGRPERGVAELFVTDGTVVTLLSMRATAAPALDVERMFASVDLGD